MFRKPLFNREPGVKDPPYLVPRFTKLRGGGILTRFDVFAPLTTSTSLSRGTGVATFTRATTATVYGFKITDNAGTGPVVVAVASGEARFWGARRLAANSYASTYADGTAISPTILLGYLCEGANTNLCLQSENFGTTWAAVGTPTRSAAALACGDLVLDLIGDDDGAALEGYTQTVTFTADAVKAVSGFFAAGTSTSTVIRLRDTTGAADRLLVTLAWAGGVPTPTATTGTVLGTDVLANSVYRIRMVTTAVTAASTHSLEVYPATNSALVTTSTGNVNAGGMQAENSTFCSSYIPTTVAIVTRNADVLTYATSGNLLGTVGAAYAEITSLKTAASNGDPIVLSTYTGTGGAPIAVADASRNLGLFDDVAWRSSTTVIALPSAAIQKVACSWGTASKAFLNGAGTAIVAFDGDLNIGPNMGVGNHANLSGRELYGVVRNLKIWKVAVPDADMVKQTT